jgi:hypothetical protein
MKKHTRILVAITFLLGLGVAANAETHAELNVTLPFEFVAGKTTLPAGKYIVKRISEQPFDVLMITSYDTGTSVLVNPTAMDNASAFRPTVSFRTIGDQHFLSGIQTADYVYNFHVSRSVTLAAAAQPHDTVSVSASGGSK